MMLFPFFLEVYSKTSEEEVKAVVESMKTLIQGPNLITFEKLHRISCSIKVVEVFFDNTDRDYFESQRLSVAKGAVLLAVVSFIFNDSKTKVKNEFEPWSIPAVMPYVSVFMASPLWPFISQYGL